MDGLAAATADIDVLDVPLDGLVVPAAWGMVVFRVVMGMMPGVWFVGIFYHIENNVIMNQSGIVVPKGRLKITHQFIGGKIRSINDSVPQGTNEKIGKKNKAFLVIRPNGTFGSLYISNSLR